MKLRIKRSRALRIAQYGFTAAGIAALGYTVAAYVEAGWFQARETQRFESEMRASRTGPPHPAAKPGVPAAPAVPADGAVIGRLEIPRLGISVMVVEGVNNGDLERGAGHIPGTALPGEAGNVGIAAHRDTFFRRLRGIKPNDTIALDTLKGDYHYRVVATNVVRPEDTAVLDPAGRDSLTLVTCFPFYYAGPAPERFIVRAERTRGAALPASDLSRTEPPPEIAASH